MQSTDEHYRYPDYGWEVNCVERLQDFIRQTMEEWQVPGLGVGIIHKGKTVLCEGYGLRDVENGLRVTPNTVFGLGSVTKSFTCTAMGILVDEGKLEWDRPVKEYLPDFKLFDAYATDHVTPRDLVSHRTGLPRHNFAFWDSRLTRRELVHRLAHLEPTRELRAGWQYTNGMVVTAGYLVEAVAQCSWEEFIQQRILDPLEMTSTSTLIEQMKASADFALPYFQSEGKLVQVPFRSIGSNGPAGAINSNVADQLRWLKFHMNVGGPDRKPVLSESCLNEMHSPQMLIRDSEREPHSRWMSGIPEMGQACYGMGWSIQPYRGRTLLHHGGAIDGFMAFVSFMPREQTGIVLLSNLNANSHAVPVLVTFTAYDYLLGVEPLPWPDLFRKGRAHMLNEQANINRATTPMRRPGTQPSHPLEEYAGVYHHPGYGKFSVSVDGDELRAEFAAETFPLRHYHYDTFAHTFGLDDVPIFGGFTIMVSFLTDRQGRISGLSIPLEPLLGETVFTREVNNARLAHSAWYDH